MAVLGIASLICWGLDSWRRGRTGRACLLLFLLVTGPEIAAQAAPTREYQVKAVFLFNFAQFVEWPTSVFPDTQTPLVIGILGDDPFGPFLDETVRDEKVEGRQLLVRRYRHISEVDRCHILFVSQAEVGLENIFTALKGRSILTVGESDGFAKRGGMIRFVTEKNKIRLRINLESATAGGLKVSSKLLRPAEIVGNKGN